MKFNLAIYTANHGLDWTYDRSVISYSDLNACRTLLRPLPNFESGDCGYEGVALKNDMVFAIRCFRVPKWDFMGRDATYLAVAWAKRDCIGGVDVEKVLLAPPMMVAMKNPPTQFDVHIDVQSEIHPAPVVGGRVIKEGERCVRNIGASVFKWSRDRLVVHNGTMRRQGNVNVRRRTFRFSTRQNRDGMKKSLGRRVIWIAGSAVMGCLCVNVLSGLWHHIEKEVACDGSGGVSQKMECGAGWTRGACCETDTNQNPKYIYCSKESETVRTRRLSHSCGSCFCNFDIDRHVFRQDECTPLCLAWVYDWMPSVLLWQDALESRRRWMMVAIACATLAIVALVAHGIVWSKWRDCRFALELLQVQQSAEKID